MEVHRHKTIYGVELQEGKGANLCADANVALLSLDLAKFNVIDVDSYGIPFEICFNLIKDEKVKRGTVILYTTMTNIFTQIPRFALDKLGINEMYKLAPSLFNQNSITYFYDMLGNCGIKEVNYYRVIDNYTKHYGYFIIP